MSEVEESGLTITEFINKLGETLLNEVEELVQNQDINVFFLAF